MKDIVETERELEFVEWALRNAYKEDDRKVRWEGYRDALLWILNRKKDEECQDQRQPMNLMKM